GHPRADQPVPRRRLGHDRRRDRPSGDAPGHSARARAGAGQKGRPPMAQARKHPCMKTIISAALTGVLATRDQCPAIPYTPREIGEEAERTAEAGAAIVHIHARTADGGPDWRVETFAEIFAEVRARTDVIVNFSTGAIGIPV